MKIQGQGGNSPPPAPGRSNARIKEALHHLAPLPLRRVLDRVRTSPFGARLAHGAFWSLAGALVSRLSALAASILTARLLGRENFGELGIIQSTIGMFATFAGLGLGTTATKYIAAFRLKDPLKAGRIIRLSNLLAYGTGAAAALALVLSAPFLAEKTLAAARLTPLLRIGAGVLFLGAVNGMQTGALAGFEAFRSIARINLWSAICTFPLMVGGAYWGGTEGSVWGLVLSMASNCIFSHFALRTEARRTGVPLRAHGCRHEWKVVRDFSVPAALSGAMVGPVNWLCVAMLANRTNGFAEMGIYNAANQWFSALLFLPGIFSQVILPVLSERLGENDTAMSAKILSATIKANALVILPMVIAGSAAGSLIMKSYGDGFAGGWSTLVVVLITAGLVAVQVPVGQIIAASGRMWTGFGMNLGWALVFIFSTHVFVGSGAFGLASARCISYVFHGLWTFWFACFTIRRIQICPI